MTRAYTVRPWGFYVEVTADLDPGEPMTWDHPGHGASAIVESASIGGVDVYAMLDNEQLARLEEHVLRAEGLR